MKEAIAALVTARALLAKQETMSRTPALPDVPDPAKRITRRLTLLWSWLPLLWKASHTGS